MLMKESVDMRIITNRIKGPMLAKKSSGPLDIKSTCQNDEINLCNFLMNLLLSIGAQMLKQRLKRIERNIGKNQIAKVWTIRVGVGCQKEEQEKLIEKRQADIKSGIIKNSDGSYYSDYDKNLFMIIVSPGPNRQK